MCPNDEGSGSIEYISTNGCPDALFCQNDETAICAYRALMELGRRIPEDVLLAGCDGLPHMNFFEPPLSTIALPTEEVCATAVQFLQRWLKNPSLAVRSAALPGQLILRKSLDFKANRGLPIRAQDLGLEAATTSPQVIFLISNRSKPANLSQ